MCPPRAAPPPSSGLDQTCKEETQQAGKGRTVAETGLIPLSLLGQKGLFGEYINKSFAWCQQLPLATSFLKG